MQINLPNTDASFLGTPTSNGRAPRTFTSTTTPPASSDFFGIPELTGDISRDIPAQIDYFDRAGDREVANGFRSIYNDRQDLFGGFQNNLIDQYDAFERSINPSFEQYLRASNEQAAQILPQIRKQGELVRQQFGPGGEIQTQADDFYRNLASSLNNAVSGRVSGAANTGRRTGASQNSIQSAINQARQEGLDQIIKVQADKLAQQQNLYNNLFTLQDGLRSQTFDYNNQLIRQPLLELNNRLTSLGSNLITGLQGYDAAQLNELLRQQEIARLEGLAATSAASAGRSAGTSAPTSSVASQSNTASPLSGFNLDRPTIPTFKQDGDRFLAQNGDDIDRGSAIGRTSEEIFDQAYTAALANGASVDVAKQSALNFLDSVLK